MWNKTSQCFPKPCYLDHKREKVHLFSECTGCLGMQMYYISFFCEFQRPWSNPVIFVNHVNIFIHLRKSTLNPVRLVYWCTSIYLSVWFVGLRGEKSWKQFVKNSEKDFCHSFCLHAIWKYPLRGREENYI